MKISDYPQNKIQYYQTSKLTNKTTPHSPLLKKKQSLKMFSLERREIRFYDVTARDHLDERRHLHGGRRDRLYLTYFEEVPRSTKEYVHELLLL